MNYIPGRQGRKHACNGCNETIVTPGPGTAFPDLGNRAGATHHAAVACLLQLAAGRDQNKIYFERTRGFAAPDPLLLTGIGPFMHVSQKPHPRRGRARALLAVITGDDEPRPAQRGFALNAVSH
jgi:hypothetical protein